MVGRQLSSRHLSLEDCKEHRDAKAGQPIGNPPLYEPLASSRLRQLPYTYEELEYGGGFRTVEIYSGNLNESVVCDITAYQLIA